MAARFLKLDQKISSGVKNENLDQSFSTRASDSGSSSPSSLSPKDWRTVETRQRLARPAFPQRHHEFPKSLHKGSRGRLINPEDRIVSSVLSKTDSDSKPQFPCPASSQHHPDITSSKFKTELCKNFELHGACQWSVSVS
jgi:hypothetical protein